MVGMALVLDYFVANLERSSLEKRKKAVLFAMANHCGIQVARSPCKNDLRAVVINGLYDQIVSVSVDHISVVGGEFATVIPNGDDHSNVPCETRPGLIAHEKMDDYGY